MKTYRVHLNTGASASVTVQADDEDQAMDRAYDVISEHYLCAQCGGWGRDYSVDLGEWEIDTDDGAVSEVDDQ